MERRLNRSPWSPPRRAAKSMVWASRPRDAVGQTRWSIYNSKHARPAGRSGNNGFPRWRAVNNGMTCRTARSIQQDGEPACRLSAQPSLTFLSVGWLAGAAGTVALPDLTFLPAFRHHSVKLNFHWSPSFMEPLLNSKCYLNATLMLP